jgi:uncharacterized protein YcbK (DUF882 family)
MTGETGDARDSATLCTDGGVREQACFPSGECLPVVEAPDGYHERYWDPNDSDNPLLDTSGDYRDLQVSENFRVGEFAESGTNEFDRARIDPELVRCLERLRAAVNARAGGPWSDFGVVVDSGYRSWAYNVELYEDRERDPTRSEHCSGRGADVRVPDADLSSTELAKLALQNGPPCDTRVGIPADDDYIHVDVKPRTHESWTGDGIWDYGERPANYDEVVAIRRELDDRHGCE